MKTIITIQNLKCGGCANTIATKMNALEGISEVEVDVENDAVSFTYQTEANVIAAKEKLAAIGYPEVGDANSVLSKAKSFVSCATGKMNS